MRCSGLPGQCDFAESVPASYLCRRSAGQGVERRLILPRPQSLVTLLAIRPARPFVTVPYRAPNESRNAFLQICVERARARCLRERSEACRLSRFAAS